MDAHTWQSTPAVAAGHPTEGRAATRGSSLPPPCAYPAVEWRSGEIGGSVDSIRSINTTEGGAAGSRVQAVRASETSIGDREHARHDARAPAAGYDMPESPPARPTNQPTTHRQLAGRLKSKTMVSRALVGGGRHGGALQLLRGAGLGQGTTLPATANASAARRLQGQQQVRLCVSKT